MVKNPPAKAEDMGLIPDLGRSHMMQSKQAHVPQLLSLCSRAREPQLLRPWRPRARPTGEAATVASPYTATRGQPLLAETRENPHSNKDLAQPKLNKFRKRKKEENTTQNQEKNQFIETS